MELGEKGVWRERFVMGTFPAVTDSDLARARSDPAFRQKLLTHSLEMLLARMQKLRRTAQSARRPRTSSCARAWNLRSGLPS